MPVVVLYSPEQSSWVRYDRPQAVFAARSHDEVAQFLDHLETEVERRGLHAAGFLAYEAGGAFDPAMPGSSCAPFPLAWFGLFEPPRPIALHAPAPGSDVGLHWVPELDAEVHARALGQIRRHLAAGETYQVNFTYRLRARFETDPWPLFLRLAAHQPSPHAAFVDCGDFAICCASPEMFFHRQGPEVWSRPMKGTAPRGRWAAEDEAAAASLVRSEKERAENVMIVDMVRNDLGRVCLPGSVHVPELFRAERYPTLWQLTSLVRGLSNEPTARVLAALFPAASITGAPKVRTMRIIGDLETSSRRIYTGTIGVMTPGRGARFNVAIRTVLVDRKSRTAEYGVGGGIVWDSDPAAEYRETLLKARVLEASPPGFELLETMRWSREEGIFLIDGHLRRLRESAGYFGFALDLADLREALEGELTAAPEDAGVLRLRLSKCGARVIERRPLPPSGPCRVALAAAPVDSRDAFLFHKTTRRGVYEAARAGRSGVDDVVLWNERGEVTEATIASVVVELGGALLTPPVGCGLLPGVFRQHLLDGGQVREGIVRVADLRRCDRIWLVSAVRGWREAILVDV